MKDKQRKDIAIYESLRNRIASFRSILRSKEGRLFYLKGMILSEKHPKRPPSIKR